MVRLWAPGPRGRPVSALREAGRSWRGSVSGSFGESVGRPDPAYDWGICLRHEMVRSSEVGRVGDESEGPFGGGRDPRTGRTVGPFLAAPGKRRPRPGCLRRHTRSHIYTIPKRDPARCYVFVTDRRSVGTCGLERGNERKPGEWIRNATSKAAPWRDTVHPDSPYDWGICLRHEMDRSSEVGRVGDESEGPTVWWRTGPEDGCRNVQTIPYDLAFRREGPAPRLRGGALISPVGAPKVRVSCPSRN